ncbi:hypothetical protein TWF481_006235 [Arthrobotrys musiformis]
MPETTLYIPELQDSRWYALVRYRKEGLGAMFSSTVWDRITYTKERQQPAGQFHPPDTETQVNNLHDNCPTTMEHNQSFLNSQDKLVSCAAPASEDKPMLETLKTKRPHLERLAVCTDADSSTGNKDTQPNSPANKSYLDPPSMVVRARSQDSGVTDIRSLPNPSYNCSPRRSTHTKPRAKQSTFNRSNPQKTACSSRPKRNKNKKIKNYDSETNQRARLTRRSYSTPYYLRKI